MNVEIYSKADCPLCDEAKGLLLEVQKAIPFELLEVDIEKDPVLFERFRYDIPVVFIDGRKAFKHRVAREELEKRLERARSFAMGTLDPAKTLSRTAPVSRAAKVVFAVVAVAAIAGVFLSKAYTRLVLDRERALSSLEMVAQDRPAPDFVLSGPDGKPRAISDFRGKVLLLSFYATWCGPCREEMPSMSALAEAMRGESRFALLAVDVQEDWGAVNKLFGGKKPAFHLAIDSTGKAAAAYEQRSDLMFPETYVISRQGRVVAKFEGPRDWTDPAVHAYLERLLDG